MKKLFEIVRRLRRELGVAKRAVKIQSDLLEDYRLALQNQRAEIKYLRNRLDESLKYSDDLYVRYLDYINREVNNSINQSNKEE